MLNDAKVIDVNEQLILHILPWRGLKLQFIRYDEPSPVRQAYGAAQQQLYNPNRHHVKNLRAFFSGWDEGFNFVEGTLFCW